MKEKEALEASIRVLSATGERKGKKEKDEEAEKQCAKSTDESDKTGSAQCPSNHSESGDMESSLKAKSPTSVVDHPLSVNEKHGSDISREQVTLLTKLIRSNQDLLLCVFHMIQVMVLMTLRIMMMLLLMMMIMMVT